MAALRQWFYRPLLQHLDGRSKLTGQVQTTYMRPKKGMVCSLPEKKVQLPGASIQAVARSFAAEADSRRHAGIRAARSVLAAGSLTRAGQ